MIFAILLICGIFDTLNGYFAIVKVFFLVLLFSG